MDSGSHKATWLALPSERQNMTGTSVCPVDAVHGSFVANPPRARVQVAVCITGSHGKSLVYHPCTSHTSHLIHADVWLWRSGLGAS